MREHGKSMHDIKERLDTKDLFSEEASSLSPDELKNSLAGRLEDYRTRNSSVPYRSNARTYNLRRKPRETKSITTVPADHLLKPEIRPLDDSKYSPHVDVSFLHEASESTLITTALRATLESCLSELLHSTKGFRISTALNDGELDIPIILDVYRSRSPSPSKRYSVTDRLLGNDPLVSQSQPKNYSTVTKPLDQDVLTTDRPDLHTVPLDSDIEFMERGVMSDTERYKRHYNFLSNPSLFGKAPRQIIRGKRQLVEGSGDSPITRYAGHKAEVGTKRKELEDDASLCSESSSGTSDNSDNSNDSDSEDDNVPVWSGSQLKVPYESVLAAFIRGFESDTSSSPCGDSPESGSSSSTGNSANHITPASSGSSPNGGSSLHGIRQPLSGAGIGSSNQGLAPVLKDSSASEENSTSPRPRSLICWYAAVGVACPSRRIKRDPLTRRLWGDHVCPSKKKPSHRLPDKCVHCFRQFITQELLKEHYRNMESEGICKPYSDQELVSINFEANRHGLTEERETIIEKMRLQIGKTMKKSGKPPFVFDDSTMELLAKHVESNVAIYINDSDTPETTARLELWKWYLIFKQLQPDAEVPLNPFTSRTETVGPRNKARDKALRIYNHLMDQRCEGRFSCKDRNDLNLVFLECWEMSRNTETQERGRNARKRARLSPIEEIAPSPGLPIPEITRTGSTIWQPPAPPPATVSEAPVSVQAPNTVDDPSLPIIQERLWLGPGESEDYAYQLDEEYFAYNFPSE